MYRNSVAHRISYCRANTSSDCDTDSCSVSSSFSFSDTGTYRGAF